MASLDLVETPSSVLHPLDWRPGGVVAGETLRVVELFIARPGADAGIRRGLDCRSLAPEHEGQKDVGRAVKQAEEFACPP